MFIMTEATPNPDTMKFLPGQTVMSSGSAEFRAGGDFERSPLAARLFKIDGVTGVFLGRDFISVTKQGQDDWAALKPTILSSIMDHFTSGMPVIDDAAANEVTGEADSEIVSQIKELLDTRVRPAVAQDGGDIVYHKFEDGIVYLEMHGSCSGCPSSTATLKAGIENLLRHYIPEIQEVRAVA